MTLTELIAEHAIDDANAGSWNAVATTLNTANILVIDSTWYTSRYLVDVFGNDAYRIIAGSLKTIGAVDPLVEDMHKALIGEGLDFSRDSTQAMIDTLGAAAGWSAELIAGLKAIGRRTVSPAQKYLSRDVTATECNEAWTKFTLTTFIENRAANASNQVSSGAITTLSALRTYLGAE